ncbi:hypothetical protein [Streptomyces flavidovirens]|uniref:hypothetical protein n=1 Tax=Streptomyces flavidovirens TaxID=67298 RepID=UPI0004141852|nr:hypothetical protein [Streptomyces flavidovirens]
MGIKDQFKDKAQELADQAKQAKQGKQGGQSSRGTQDEASERLRRAREDRDLGQGRDVLDDDTGEGPERYRA